MNTEDRSRLIRLAAAMTKGDPMRRAILAGCDSPKLPDALKAQCKKKEEEGKKNDEKDEKTAAWPTKGVAPGAGLGIVRLEMRREFWKRLRKAYLKMAKDLGNDASFLNSFGGTTDAEVDDFFGEALDEGAGSWKVLEIMAEMDESDLWGSHRQGFVHAREFKDIRADAKGILLRATRSYSKSAQRVASRYRRNQSDTKN